MKNKTPRTRYIRNDIYYVVEISPSKNETYTYICFDCLYKRKLKELEKPKHSRTTHEFVDSDRKELALVCSDCLAVNDIWYKRNYGKIQTHGYRFVRL